MSMLEFGVLCVLLLQSVAGYSIVAGGQKHSCVSQDDGLVYCSGKDTYGQLGIGSFEDSEVPVQVETFMPHEVVDFCAGNVFTLFVTSRGEMWGTGDNTYGALSTGDLVTYNAPEMSTMTGNVTKVACGSAHSCVLLKSGSIYCAGLGGFGANGDGTRSIFKQTAGPVNGYEAGGAVDVAVGFKHSCLVRENGNVHCFGDATQGQTGTGSAVLTVVPGGRVKGIARNVAIKVSSGPYHSCAVTSAGEVRCWGRGSSGQLGVGSTGVSLKGVEPVGLAGLFVVQVTMGERHTCLVLDSGVIKCFGANHSGQLGTGDTDPRLVPTDVRFTVPGGETVSEISAGSFFTCFALSPSHIKLCFGQDDYGQLGMLGNVPDVLLPNPVEEASGRPSVSPTPPTTFQPTTLAPTSQAPTKLPTTLSPTSQTPTLLPTLLPTSQAPTTLGPTPKPTSEAPTSLPTSLQPSLRPSNRPTLAPSRLPTKLPSNSNSPTPLPTSLQPTNVPTHLPTPPPTLLPSELPTTPPTKQPSSLPSALPSSSPEVTKECCACVSSSSPTSLPTTAQPTTPSPTSYPGTLFPSKFPTSFPGSRRRRVLVEEECCPCVPTPSPSRPTRAPTRTPTASKLKKCKPATNWSATKCNRFVNKCARWGVRMKYAGGDKCVDTVTGSNVKDQGCQCAGACDFVCESHCAADPECMWDPAGRGGAGGCLSRATGQPTATTEAYCLPDE